LILYGNLTLRLKNTKDIRVELGEIEYQVREFLKREIMQ